MMLGFLSLFELIAHTLQKIFGRRRTAEEKRFQEEAERRFTRRLIIVSLATVILGALTIYVLFRVGFLEPLS